MKRLLFVPVVVSLLITSSWAASTFYDSGGTLGTFNQGVYLDFTNKFRFVTASAFFVGPISEILYNVPPGGTLSLFILTQFCTSAPRPGGSIQLAVNVIGPIAETVSGGQTCYTFSPGVATPPSSIISCTSSKPPLTGTPSDFCMISGLLRQ